MNVSSKEGSSAVQNTVGENKSHGSSATTHISTAYEMPIKLQILDIVYIPRKVLSGHKLVHGAETIDAKESFLRAKHPLTNLCSS
jgi:hypothetical protein